ncbi:hypothetical protein Tco_0020210 [Tanacetum coccineum]
MSMETKLTREEEGKFVDIPNKGHDRIMYPKGSDIENIVYADSDHAGDYVDRKSTSAVCTFMGCASHLGFQRCKLALAISTTEAEFVMYRERNVKSPVDETKLS